MLKDAGASEVIVGHSERRDNDVERDAMVAAKAQAAWRAGFLAIICIGETRRPAQPARRMTFAAARSGSVPERASAANTVIAYEPVWAIGTGKTPTAEEITAMHAHIRKGLAERLGEARGDAHPLWRIGETVQCRGNPRPSGSQGALVGGASLKADDFLALSRP